MERTTNMQERDFEDAANEIDSTDINAENTTAAAPTTDGAGGAGTVGAPHDPAVPATMPAAPPDTRLINPFVAFRQRNSTGGAFFHGPIVKCDHRSGEWVRVRGENESPIDPDERLVVNPLEMVDTWAKFIDGKRVEGKVYRTADGEFAPAREALGDMDERKWPWDRSGKQRKDPWQRAVYLPLRGEDGEICAFKATGAGAIAEIGELVGMYGSADRHGKLPVIKPDSRSFESQHGSVIYVPVFRLVDWDYWEPNTPTPAVAPVPIPPPAPAKPGTRLAEEGARPRRHGRRDPVLARRCEPARCDEQRAGNFSILEGPRHARRRAAQIPFLPGLCPHRRAHARD
jgi:hypothetical protein